MLRLRPQLLPLGSPRAAQEAPPAGVTSEHSADSVRQTAPLLTGCEGVFRTRERHRRTDSHGTDCLSFFLSVLFFTSLTCFHTQTFTHSSVRRPLLVKGFIVLTHSGSILNNVNSLFFFFISQENLISL